jgi:PAS domain S-box-containing protein
MKKKILIVEDERIVAEDMAQCLEVAGYEIVGIAKRGDEAIKLAEEHNPNLILMDIVIRGELDGIETAAIIRDRFQIPHIFLTAYSQEGILERAKATEPLGYLVKPYEEANLISTVEIAMHKAGLDRELASSLEWFYTTLKCIGDGVIATHTDGKIAFMNNKAEVLTGWKFEDASEEPISDIFKIVNEDSGEKVDNPALVSLRTQKSEVLAPRTVLIRRDGTKLPIDDAGSPIRNSNGELIGAVLVFRDISLQREAEKKVINYQSQLENKVEERTDALRERIELESFVTSLSLSLIQLEDQEFDGGLIEILGKLGEFLTLDSCSLFQSATLKSGRALVATHGWRSAKSSHSPVKKLPENCARQDSWWSSQIHQKGYILVNSVEDIPESAGEEREVFAEFGSRSLVVIPMGDDQNLTGLLTLCPADERDWSKEDVRILLMLGQFIGSIIVRRRAETERTKLAEELIQSRKLEAIGKLSGGIAHDFNNMLVPIIGYSDVLIARMEEDGESSNEILAIRAAAESAAGLTRQLLSFARKQILKKTDTSLHEVIRGMRGLLERALGEDISFEVYSNSNSWNILADKSQFEQVIMNLCVNARYAMADGGSIIINLENVSLPQGDFVFLCVEDTGPGMERKVLERIFEPFFSTKGNDGTGLGLSVVLGIVEQHDGKISVDSEPGRGTRFNVWIPRKAKSEVDVQSVRPNSLRAGMTGGSESILLIEDEASVITFVSQALRQKGYHVETAMSVAEAFKVYEENGGLFNLIFSDAMLPDGTGMEVVEKLLDQNKNLCALLSSGYTDHRSLIDMANDRRIAFLHKPYALPDLYKTVRSVLDGEERALLS